MVEQVHGSGCRVSLLTTGGGSRAVSWLLNHPGASRVMLEAHVPYHPAALARFLESTGPHKVVAETARRMFVGRLRQALSLLPDVEPSARYLCDGDRDRGGLHGRAGNQTGSVRGGDRAYVAIRKPQQYHLAAIEFDPVGGRDRLAQEEVLSSVIVQQLAGWLCVQSEPGMGLPPWAGVEEGRLPVHFTAGAGSCGSAEDAGDRPGGNRDRGAGCPQPAAAEWLVQSTAHWSSTAGGSRSTHHWTSAWTRAFPVTKCRQGRARLPGGD